MRTLIMILAMPLFGNAVPQPREPVHHQLHINDYLPDLDVVKAELVEALQCRTEGGNCHGFPECCGDLVCSWDVKWNPFARGVCVDCINQEELCYRDEQCCGDLQCDR